MAVWRLLTSVDFAVAQILFLAILAVVGMTIQQLPDFALRSPSDYAAAMEATHARYDPVLGAGVVGVLERLGAFTVFRSAWFGGALVVLAVSIVVCTLDRTPRLWRGVADVRVSQPDAFFDPRLPDRAVMPGGDPDGVRRSLRRSGFRVRDETADDGTRYLYGDRHQYTKMATLLTHMGLILFLVAAAVTSRFGQELGLIVAEGDSLTVQPIGTPGLLLVKNHAFEAPGIETGMPSDFTTDLSVFQDGQEIARKTIRVNDPLAIAGFTFHQNGFGAAPHLLVRDTAGRPLWDGAVPLVDEAAGSPYGILPVPGRDLGLQLLLRRTTDGTSVVLVLPYRIIGEDPVDGSPIVENFTPLPLAKGETGIAPDLDFTVTLVDFSEYTLLIAKNDPGQGIVWLAFLCLIAGIAVTFYLPRRRVWTRIAADGEVAIVWRSDRYIDVEREFGRLLDDLVASRRPG